MKKLILLTTALLSLFATSMHAQTNANHNILVKTENAEAAAKTPEEKTAADKWTARLGTGWRDTWRNSTLANPNNAIVDAYIEKDGFEIFNGDNWTLSTMDDAKKQEWLLHIAAKKELTANDFSVVFNVARYNSGILAREAELVKFLKCGPNIKSEEYFQFLITRLELRKVTEGRWSTALRSDEMFVLASANAHFSPTTFADGRNAIAMRAARLLLEKRSAAGLSSSGEEFDAAFAPIIDALKSPKFNMLQAAAESVGINLDLPTDTDWTVQENVAQQVIGAAERKGAFTAAWGVSLQYDTGLGSVMFVKGETEYNSWRAQTIAKD